jgi:hypothetical protein
MSTATAVHIQATRRALPDRLGRIVVLALLFCAAAVYEAAHLSALSNIEVWRSLRTGIWILQNHAVPHSGIFSQYSDLPWVDSSWGYDVAIALAYKSLGLRAIPAVLMVLKIALAVVAFLLARATGARFWMAIVLSSIAQYVIPALQPVPAVISILFFGVELLLLLRSRQLGDVRVLFWMPALFLLWANLHIQFVCGLVLLALFVIAACIEQWLRSSSDRWIDDRIVPLPLAKVGAVAATSFLATFATPYAIHLIPGAFRTLYSDVAFEHFAEMRAMSFRRPQEFALMLLVMAAFLALGRPRRLQIFELVALTAGTLIAFRIQRDAWLAVLPALAILSAAFRPLTTPEQEKPESTRWQIGAVAILVAAILTTAVGRLPSESVLLNRASQNFPVKACDFISQNRLPEPLFNPYSWGDFLTWYLPQYPVVIDSRVELYGDEILSRYFDVTGGKERLDSDPKLLAARTLLLERNSGMAKAMSTLPALTSQYRLVYSDDLAAIFVRQ